MKITVIYDNEVYQKGLRADWGVACLVEVENKPTILFDTGANGSLLLSNMEKLNIDPASIDEVFISHAHFDHTGGLSAVLRVKRDMPIYVPCSISGVRGAMEVIRVSEPLEIHENVFSTGELGHIEQSLAVKIDRGVVLIVGCSHPGVSTILKAASQFGKVCGIVGGLHGFSQFGLFEGLELICPAHCTYYKEAIKALYAETCIDGGTGRVIEF